MPTPQEHYESFRLQFHAMSDKQLIDAFNHEVGNDGWVSARASYLVALGNEFQRRGYDYSAVGDETRLSFRRKVKLENHTIVPIEPVIQIVSRGVVYE